MRNNQRMFGPPVAPTKNNLRIYDAIEKIAEENPERKNYGWVHPEDGSQCLYTSENGCHCFVGEIMVRLGIKPPEFGSPHNARNASSLWDKIPQLHDAMNFDEACMVDDLQREADQGMTWGEVAKLNSYLTWKKNRGFK